MTPDELQTTMRRALHDEREGIRHLDIDAVTRATVAKENILFVLHLSSGSERLPLLAALAEMSSELQENLLLLAHARDVLREAARLTSIRDGEDRRLRRLVPPERPPVQVVLPPEVMG